MKELPSRQQCRGPGLSQKDMSTREGGRKLQVAGEGRKEHLDREAQKKRLGCRHSGGHINNLSLFPRVTGDSTGTQKCPACPLCSNLT